MTSSRPHPCSGAPARPTLVLGVEPHQDPSIVRGAVELAGMLDASLACVWVDPTRVNVGREAGATLEATPVDPDNDGDLGQGFGEADMLARLGRVLGVAPAPWRFLYRAGDVTHGLRAVAGELDAVAVAVGTRRPGLPGWMDEAIGGSLAARLAHTQDRLVIIVPPRGRTR